MSKLYDNVDHLDTNASATYTVETDVLVVGTGNAGMEVLDENHDPIPACTRQVTMPVASSGAATMTASQVWQPATRTPLAVWLGNLLLD